MRFSLDGVSICMVPKLPPKCVVADLVSYTVCLAAAFMLNTALFEDPNIRPIWLCIKPILKFKAKFHTQIIISTGHNLSSPTQNIEPPMMPGVSITWSYGTNKN